MSNTSLTLEIEKGPNPKITMHMPSKMVYDLQKLSFSGYQNALKALGKEVWDGKLQRKNCDTLNTYILQGMHKHLIDAMYEKWPNCGSGEKPVFDNHPFYSPYEFKQKSAFGGGVFNDRLRESPDYWLRALDPTKYPAWYIEWTENGWSFHKSKEDGIEFVKRCPKTMTANIYGKDKELFLSPEASYSSRGFEKPMEAHRKHWVDQSKFGCLWVLGYESLSGEEIPLFYESNK